MKRLIVPVLLLTLASAGSPQSAPDVGAAIAKCRTVTDSLQRLVCYDAVADGGGKSGGTAALPLAAPASPSTPPARAAASDTASKRCAATTKKGTQCSRMAKPGSASCWQHGG